MEGVLLRNVIDQAAAVCTSVESTRQRLEALLPRCVPNLQDDDSVFQVDLLIREISADRRLEMLSELGMLELLDQRGLTHGGVTDYDHFDEVLARRATLTLSIFSGAGGRKKEIIDH